MGLGELVEAVLAVGAADAAFAPAGARRKRKTGNLLHRRGQVAGLWPGEHRGRVYRTAATVVVPAFAEAAISSFSALEVASSLMEPGATPQIWERKYWFPY